MGSRLAPIINSDDKIQQVDYLHLGRAVFAHLPAPTPKDALNPGGHCMKANSPGRPELRPRQVAPPNTLNLILAFQTLFLVTI